MPLIQFENLSHKVDEKIIFNKLSSTLDINEIVKLGVQTDQANLPSKIYCGLHTSKNIILSESSENNIAYLTKKCICRRNKLETKLQIKWH